MKFACPRDSPINSFNERIYLPFMDALLNAIEIRLQSSFFTWIFTQWFLDSDVFENAGVFESHRWPLGCPEMTDFGKPSLSTLYLVLMNAKMMTTICQLWYALCT